VVSVVEREREREEVESDREDRSREAAAAMHAWGEMGGAHRTVPPPRAVYSVSSILGSFSSEKKCAGAAPPPSRRVAAAAGGKGFPGRARRDSTRPPGHSSMI
jgi:hypothetical protein